MNRDVVVDTGKRVYIRLSVSEESRVVSSHSVRVLVYVLDGAAVDHYFWLALASCVVGRVVCFEMARAEGRWPNLLVVRIEEVAVKGSVRANPIQVWSD